MFISGTSTRSNERSTSPVLAGSGLRWRRWAQATLCPSVRARLTPARIAPSLEPHPSTSSFAPASASTSSAGSSSAIPAIFAARSSVIRAWLAAS